MLIYRLKHKYYYLFNNYILIKLTSYSYSGIFSIIMKEKPIIDEYFIDNNEMKFFFKNIFKQDKNKAYRRDDNYYDYKCKK